MPDTTAQCEQGQSRVDERVKRMDRPGMNARVLAGEVAGTSEETARLFGSDHTLAEDRTGPADDEGTLTPGS